ncbi:MAG: dihydrodipicolinate synthase family protein [Vicinamibacteraceae bacterium]
MTTIQDSTERPPHAALSGLFAAVTTPRLASGAVDLAIFESHLELLVEAGVDGICLGGATAEYPHLEVRERLDLVSRAARTLPRDKTLLVGIGASSIWRVLELGEHAFEHGSRAVLLPMPMFFRYDQDDLYAYVAEIARALQAPCLLYDLPDFTSPLAPETAITLLTQEPHVVGIKDSSGRPDHLGRYVDARGARSWTLLIGDDSKLADGLALGWNGGVSGLASVCPELLVALVRAATSADAKRLAHVRALISELIAALAVFPVPWGIRLALQTRGLPVGPLPWPMSDARRAHAARLKTWLPAWLERAQASDWSHVSSSK